MTTVIPGLVKFSRHGMTSKASSRLPIAVMIFASMIVFANYFPASHTPQRIDPKEFRRKGCEIRAQVRTNSKIPSSNDSANYCHFRLR